MIATWGQEVTELNLTVYVLKKTTWGDALTKKFLEQSKLNTFADNKINVTKKIEILFENSKKYCGKRRKRWLPAFSPFPTMFSKSFLRVAISQDCGNELTLYQTKNFWTRPNSNHLQTTIQMLLNWWFLSLIEKKTLWEKEKMLDTGIFSFSQISFQKPSFSGTSGLCGKELTLSQRSPGFYVSAVQVF